MENSKKPVPNAVAKTHQQISDLYKSNKTLKNTEADLNDLSRMVNKMFGKYERENVSETISHLFSIAMEKMESDHDKEVLVGLRQMVKEVETNLYRPNPRF